MIETEAGISAEMLQLHLFISVHFRPPGSIVLQPLGKPGKDGVLPFQSLLVVDDVMILTIYQYHRRRTAKKFQRCIELERFTDSHRKAFFGKCVVVIKGKGTLKAQAVDLKDASVAL